MTELVQSAAAVSWWSLAAFLAIIDICALALVIRSGEGARTKALWGAAIVLVPILGCVVSYVLGPKPPGSGEG